MAEDQPCFGALLRRYRVMAGLTQEALATRAGLSLRGVSDLERGMRRLPYPDTVERLIVALGLGPADQAALRTASRPAPTGAQDDGSSLPPVSVLPVALTSFIGREHELSEVGRLLRTARLVTLTGAGGMGKTRLAIEAAQQQSATFAQRVIFVPLAGVASPSLLASAIAAALGLSFYGPAEPNVQLVSHLRDERLLLILDNFEHLVNGGTTFLTDILSGAPGVTMLITSRERLNSHEEWVLPIEGLLFPDQCLTGPIDGYPAVELFVQRARQHQPDFSLAENAQSVIAICRQVDGMPLALELAAPWLRIMPCDQIALQIERSLDFLTTSVRNVPDRHRSLRVVFDRSWSLLSDDERRVLRSLSVFRGGFDATAGQQVAGASLALLASLVDKSLLQVTAAGRYEVHELVRQYLSIKLVESGSASDLTGRHFDFCLELAERAEAQLNGPDQEAWFDRLETEFDNLAAALDWSLCEKRPDAGLRLAAALGFFWEHRGHFRDGYDWFEKLLEFYGSAPSALRAKALRTAGVFALLVGETGKATARCQEGLTVARAAGDQWNAAWSLASLGLLESSDLSRATELLAEALRLFRALGDGWAISHALRRLGWFATMQADYERAATLLDEALRLARQVRNKHATSWSLFLLGNVVWAQTRDPVRTLALYHESLSLVSETRDRHNLEYLLLMLGQVAHAQGDYDQAQSRYDQFVGLVEERGGIDYRTVDVSPAVLGFARLAVARGKPDQAARLFGAAHMALANPHPELFCDRGAVDRDIDAARLHLGDVAFAVAFAEGRGMSSEQAVAHAVDGRALKPAGPWP